ncbi:hypothetical protein BJ912DRAFT_995569 [Pholiota molesta]|nr:hypothetical protein BJ912DRAFT_995569 [Pholiota molesta]
MSAKASSLGWLTCLLCWWLERSVVHNKIRIALRVIHVPHKSPLHHHRPITRFRRRAASATRSNLAPPNLHGAENQAEGDVDGVRIVAVRYVRGNKSVVYSDGWGAVDPVGPGVAPMGLRCLFEEGGVADRVYACREHPIIEEQGTTMSITVSYRRSDCTHCAG